MIVSRAPDYVEFEKAKYFPALDGMRALCVLLVFFNHTHAPYPHWIIGWLGVDVFYVLSGFLITTLLLRERERTGGVSLRGFYIRRFFRIVPVYFFTIVLYFAATYALHDPLKIAQYKAALPWLLSFLPEYRPEASGNVLGHAWTLGIEEKFYIFWPVLLLALFPFKVRGRWLLAAIFAAILLFPHRYARSYDGLLIGALLAIALSAQGRWPMLAKAFALPDLVLCALVIGTYAACGYDYRMVLFFSAAIALLVASLATRTGFVRSALSNRALVFIGKRSYAMYLIHVLVLNVVERLPARFAPASGIVVVAIAYALTLGVASLMYVAIERPCIAYGRKISTGSLPIKQPA